MWTPDQLRQRTEQANRGHLTRQQAEEAAHDDARFQAALRNFESEAATASAKGEREAISLELEFASDVKSVDQFDARSKALLERTRSHFESQGYKTRVRGPFVTGKLNSPSTGFDLYVQW